ncbi:MAG TPA: hypothetical protein VEC13_01060 [Candidatus Paceibacterota bacterium]|nr:hypothetical protein [Candidatus Paceibacterota bacterium]
MSKNRLALTIFITLIVLIIFTQAFDEVVVFYGELAGVSPQILNLITFDLMPVELIKTAEYWLMFTYLFFSWVLVTYVSRKLLAWSRRRSRVEISV